MNAKQALCQLSIICGIIYEILLRYVFLSPDLGIYDSIHLGKHLCLSVFLIESHYFTPKNYKGDNKIIIASLHSTV